MRIKLNKNNISFVLLLLPVLIYSQNVSNTDPNYWQNKLPTGGYWQQDVHYTIRAEMDEHTDILSGYEKLVYTNNSPDTLLFVYFHLYQNAFQPDSYLDQMNKGNRSSYDFGEQYQQKKLGTVVESVTSAGTVLLTEMDNTIFKVLLEKPLLPGESAEFEINFKTWFDITSGWGRMRVFDAWGNKHYNGAHFYPRMAVYDRLSGWDTDQHLGHEFYGDFGTYDIELTFANNFIVDATGVLQNSEQVMPIELRQKLDIKNFKDKPLDEAPSVIIPYDSSVHKTWIFHAENVIDFAFLADPTYRIGEVEWNGIKCVALAQEPHASGWQDAAELTARIIQIYSEDFGMYEYPKMIVSDAQSGMEYPMLTMDGGMSPEYTHLLAHEVGHNWFYGMLSNNETYQGSLDEGFTQFLTIWALNKLMKERAIELPDKRKYVEKFGKKYPKSYTAAYYSYLTNAIHTQGVQLNTHSDMFSTRQSYGSEYRQVYNKTAVMLFNLQYVLGDEFFQRTIKNYVAEWKFCHPYLSDFRNSVINYTNINLNWFFDQWLETNKTINYSVASVKRKGGKGRYQIVFKRKGLMQMPLDFTVFTKHDSILSYHVPNTWFVKETKATVLPKWTGWNNLNKKYKAIIIVPDGIRDLVIDTSGRLADIYRLDNSKKAPLILIPYTGLNNLPDWGHYEISGRPELWWNGYDGVKAGFNINGNYMDYHHLLDATFWFNTGFVQQRFNSAANSGAFNVYSFRVSYRTPITMVTRNTWVNIYARRLDGIHVYKGGIEQWSRSKEHMFAFYFKSMFMANKHDINYLLYPDEWSHNHYGNRMNFNNTINLGYRFDYVRKRVEGSMEYLMRTSAFGSDFNFSSISLNSVNNVPLWKLVLRTRIFLQYAFGYSIPKESSLFLAGGNPEEMIENKYTRSTGFADKTWLGYGLSTNHFQYGGGLNLRAYAGYLVAQPDKEGEIKTVYRGHSGTAINAELEFDGIIKFSPRFIRKYLRLKTYLFADAGVISVNDINDNLLLSDLRADAGVGIALTIKKWGPFEKAKPLTIRFDMPFFINSTPAVDPGFFKFRWIVAVCRAF